MSIIWTVGSYSSCGLSLPHIFYKFDFYRRLLFIHSLTFYACRCFNQINTSAVWILLKGNQRRVSFSLKYFILGMCTLACLFEELPTILKSRISWWHENVAHYSFTQRNLFSRTKICLMELCRHSVERKLKSFQRKIKLMY